MALCVTPDQGLLCCNSAGAGPYLRDTEQAKGPEKSGLVSCQTFALCSPHQEGSAWYKLRGTTARDYSTAAWLAAPLAQLEVCQGRSVRSGFSMTSWSLPLPSSLVPWPLMGFVDGAPPTASPSRGPCEEKDPATRLSRNQLQSGKHRPCPVNSLLLPCP